MDSSSGTPSYDGAVIYSVVFSQIMMIRMPNGGSGAAFAVYLCWAAAMGRIFGMHPARHQCLHRERVPLVLLLFQGFGFGLIFSTLNVFLRDIGQVLAIALQLGSG